MDIHPSWGVAVLREFKWPEHDRRIARIPVDLAEIVGWLGLPDGLSPVNLQVSDDGQCAFLTVVGDKLDPVAWGCEPPILRLHKVTVSQSFSVGDGGPDFERVAREGSPEAEAMGGLTPEKLLAAVREQVEVSA